MNSSVGLVHVNYTLVVDVEMGAVQRVEMLLREKEPLSKIGAVFVVVLKMGPHQLA